MKTNNIYWRIFSGLLALLASVSLISCGGGGDSGSGGGGGGTPSSSSSFSSFSINGLTGVINNTTKTKTVAISMPSGTAVTGLIATFSSNGSAVSVGGVNQVSGVTSNNFTSPVTYVVTAADGSSSTYTVTVTVSSVTAKAISSFSINGVTGTINGTTNTIGVVLPSGTAVTGLIATFSTTGSTVKVGSTSQISGVTSNNFTNPVAYVVTAADGSTTTYSVITTVASTTAKAMTSFTLGGAVGTISDATKTIGVVLPSGTAVTGLIATFSTTGSGVAVGGVAQVSGITSNNFTSPVAYVVTAADGSTTAYTVTVSVAATTAKAMTSYSLNGVAGTINEAAKTIGVVLPSGTAVTGLIATFSTTGSGVAVGGVAQVSGSTSNNFTSPVAYVLTAADSTTATYTVTVTVATATAKAITSFSLLGVSGTIDETAKTIGVLLPSGTTVTGLIASFITTGSNVTVGGLAQVSGATSNNFTSSVVYVVTAADSSTTSYTVSVLVSAATSKAMTAYSLSGVAGTINEVSKTISVALPSGTAVTGLIATFSTTGSTVNVGGVAQVSGATTNNFSSPVPYVITAADNSTATYTVTATVAAAGPAPVALGTAGNYVLFSNAGMSSSPNSAITGDVGVGPGVTSTAITTGFTLTQVGTYATAPQVTGRVYAFNYDVPTPAYITTSSNDMGIAYDDARGRLNPDFTNLGGANLGGLILAPGLYKWSSSIDLAVSTTLTLNGGPNDVWILQVAGGLTTGANTNISLTGGAVPENVFWQLDTGLTIGATSRFSGVVLAGSAITVGAGSIINGRLLAKTAITMDSDTITKPAK